MSAQADLSRNIFLLVNFLHIKGLVFAMTQSVEIKDKFIGYKNITAWLVRYTSEMHQTHVFPEHKSNLTCILELQSTEKLNLSANKTNGHFQSRNKTPPHETPPPPPPKKKKF